MGRKIPAKKHRGVKDPLKQQEQRLKNLKGKINAAPRDPDEQPVPRSLLRLFGLQEPAPAKAHARRPPPPPSQHNPSSSTRSGGGGRGVRSGGNPVSALRRLPGEDGRAFSLRINSAVRLLHDTTSDSYPSGALDEAADVKGAAMLERRERRARRRARAGQGQGEGQRPPRTHALTLKKKASKEKQQQAAAAAAAELRYERVAFGDVATAPPALPAPRRARPRPAGAQRPGQRTLLLHALLDAAAPAPAPPPARAPAPAPAAAERERRERARLDAVAAYRTLKRDNARSVTAKRQTAK